MSVFGKMFTYLNLFNRIGKKQYSIFFPFSITFFCAVVLEFYTHQIIKNPNAVEAPAIIIFLGLIIYFAFHDGIRGGITATITTIIYYFYIITTRQYVGSNAIAGFETTLAFGILYLSLTFVIGGLKQKTDTLLEREAIEKNRLQTIIQQMPVGIIVVDKNGVVTHGNKQLEIISGYKIPIGSVLGKNKILIPETYGIKSAHSPLTQVLKTGKRIIKREYLIKRKDNKKKFIQISASPIFGKNNQVIAAIAVIMDITQQKDEEQRKDDFVNIASHELRTPITSLKLYVNSLAHRTKKERNNQSAKIIRSIDYQINRLEELVNDLLDVSRLQTGKMILKKEVFSFNDLLKSTLTSLQVITNEQNIIFSEAEPLLVSADKFRVSQVITNLITNASKYSPAKSAIVVTIKRNEEYAVVNVKDSGIGIPKEQQKKIFNRLYQVTDTKEKTFPGLGIGLYISRQIIKRHKGQIWVESERGKGSTFSFSLPLHEK